MPAPSTSAHIACTLRPCCDAARGSPVARDVAGQQLRQAAQAQLAVVLAAQLLEQQLRQLVHQLSVVVVVHQAHQGRDQRVAHLGVEGGVRVRVKGWVEGGKAGRQAGALCTWTTSQHMPAILHIRTQHNNSTIPRLGRKHQQQEAAPPTGMCLLALFTQAQMSLRSLSTWPYHSSISPGDSPRQLWGTSARTSGSSTVVIISHSAWCTWGGGERGGDVWWDWNTAVGCRRLRLLLLDGTGPGAKHADFAVPDQ